MFCGGNISCRLVHSLRCFHKILWVCGLYHSKRKIYFFAKAKVALLISQTLPTLELLAVFLAIKCLGNVFKHFSKESFVVVDTQIVLSWLFSEGIKTKNQFVKNRLKDINKTTKESVVK